MIGHSISETRGRRDGTPHCAIALLVDVDDFVATRAEKGSGWAEQQLAAVRSVVDQAAYEPEVAHLTEEPPDEWLLLLESSEPSQLARKAETVATQIWSATRSLTQSTVTVSIGLPAAGTCSGAEARASARRANRAKLLLGGDRLISAADSRASVLCDSRLRPPLDLAADLAVLVRRGDRIGVTALVDDLVDRCARMPEVSVTQLHVWLLGSVLTVLDWLSTKFSDDGSTDWLATVSTVSTGLLHDLGEIHERSYLTRWLADAIDQVADYSAQAGQRTLLTRVEEYISGHYHDKNLQLRTLSTATAVSPYHISHMFRSQRNTTFLQYLTRVRLCQARKLLADLNVPVSEVAEQVGYPSSKRLRSVFLREMGCTPTAYRRQIAVR